MRYNAPGGYYIQLHHNTEGPLDNEGLVTNSICMSVSYTLMCHQMQFPRWVLHSTVVTPRAHARSGVKQWVLSVSVSVSQSVCQSVCHQNFGLITTTKGLNACKRHSNNGNSTQIRLGTRLSWPRIRGARIRVQSMSASHSHSTGIVPRR